MNAPILVSSKGPKKSRFSGALDCLNTNSNFFRKTTLDKYFEENSSRRFNRDHEICETEYAAYSSKNPQIADFGMSKY